MSMMGMRCTSYSFVGQDGLKIVQGFDKNDNVSDFMKLSDEELKKALKIMMWDLYEELSAEIQKGFRFVLNLYEAEGKIAEGIMSAIVFINIQKRISEGYELGISDDINAVWELPLEIPGFDLKEYKDLYHQMNQFKNNGKLVPSNLLTMGKLDEARGVGKKRVVEILENCNI